MNYFTPFNRSTIFLLTCFWLLLGQATTQIDAISGANANSTASQQQQTVLLPKATADRLLRNDQPATDLGFIELNKINANNNNNNNQQVVLLNIKNLLPGNMALATIVSVNNTNLHEPRIELRYQSQYPFASILESAPNNTVVAAVIVADEDNGPNGEVSLSIEQGNELGHFKLVSTQYTHTIQVNGAPLSRNRIPEYNLTIVARDHGTPPRSSIVNLVIKLQALTSDQLTFTKPPTDLMYVGAMLVVIFSSMIFLIIIACALVQTT